MSEMRLDSPGGDVTKAVTTEVTVENPMDHDGFIQANDRLIIRADVISIVLA